MNARIKKWVAILALVTLGILLAWIVLFPAEPVYHGKPLSAWANQWGSNHWRIPSSAESKQLDHEAEAAIGAIGDKGIPFSLERMRATDSVLKKKLRAIVPRTWHSRLRVEDRSSGRKVTGAHGLAALGTNGGAAVSGLMELARVEMIRNPPDRNDGYLPVWTLGYLWAAAEPAVPLLVECLTNQNDMIRLDAAHSLGMIARRPDLAVPALLRHFNGLEPAASAECHAALQSLGQFGTNAAAATPLFLSLLKNSDPSFRQVATNWLPNVNRAAAEKAGVRIPWR